MSAGDTNLKSDDHLAVAEAIVNLDPKKLLFTAFKEQIVGVVIGFLKFIQEKTGIGSSLIGGASSASPSPNTTSNTQASASGSGKGNSNIASQTNSAGMVNSASVQNAAAGANNAGIKGGSSVSTNSPPLPVTAANLNQTTAYMWPK